MWGTSRHSPAGGTTQGQMVIRPLAFLLQRHKGATVDKREDLLMSTALIIILLALLLGGVGLAVEALRWLLIVALVLIVIGALSGWRRTA